MRDEHEDGLFADPRPAQPATRPLPDPPGLPDWQVASLRKGLDELGLKTMDDRQKVIQRLAGRPVSSLRDLTFGEARAISEALAARKNTAARTGSSWDTRDEDTWIDRM